MTKPAQFNGVTGDVGDILFVMFGPRQHDSHVGRYRWHLRLLDADRRSAAVAEEAQRMCAAYRAGRGR